MLTLGTSPASTGQSFRQTMKSAVFARPNLKLFLLGAVLLVCLQALITAGQSSVPFQDTPVSFKARALSPEDLRALLREVELHPSYRASLRLSLHFEKIRDYRKALQYLRQADKLAALEDGPEG